MSDKLNRTHKVIKNDTLSGMAKKYGHKDWKTIWNAPENKSIVSKRKKPELIQPGDIFIIPPNERELKDVEQRIVYLNNIRNKDAAAYKELLEYVKTLEAKIAGLETSIDDEKSSTAEFLKTQKDNLDELTNFAGNIDLAAAIANMAASSAMAAKKGYDLAKGSASVLKTTGIISLKVAKSQILTWDNAAKIVNSLDEEEPDSVIGVIAESWLKMTSPSFWANTYVLMKDGKSWSEASTAKVGDDIKKIMKDHLAASQQKVAKLEAQLKAAKNDLASTQQLIAIAKERLLQQEKELKDLV